MSSRAPHGKSKALAPNQVADEPQEVGGLLYFAENSFRGPIPPPDELRAYEEIVPGLANRLVSCYEEQVTMAHEQSLHRQALEKHVVHGDSFRSTMGLVFAFVVMLAALAGAGVCAVHGALAIGVAFIAAPVIAAVIAFINVGQKRTEERAQKAQALQR